MLGGGGSLPLFPPSNKARLRVVAVTHRAARLSEGMVSFKYHSTESECTVFRLAAVDWQPQEWVMLNTVFWNAHGILYKAAHIHTHMHLGECTVSLFTQKAHSLCVQCHHCFNHHFFISFNIWQTLQSSAHIELEITLREYLWIVKLEFVFQISELQFSSKRKQWWRKSSPLGKIKSASN